MKKMQLTILVEKGESYFVGQIQEYPAVASQGKTINELKANLKDALKLYLEYQNDQLGLNKPKKEILKKTMVFEQ